MAPSRDSSEDFFNSFGNSPAPAPAASSSTSRAPPPPPPPPRASASAKMSNTQSSSSYYGNKAASGAGGSSYYGASSSAYPSASSAPTSRSAAPAPAATGSSYYGSSSAYTTPAPAASAPAPTPAPAPAPASDTDWYGVPSSTNAAPAPSASAANPAAASGGMAFYSTAGPTPNPSTDATSNTSAAPTAFSGTIMSGPMGTNPSAPAPIGTNPPSTANTPNTTYNNQQVEEEDYTNEPPLMEELGINIPHIITKLRAVVLPIGKYTSSHVDETLMEDTDMAGPLAFALLLGGELLLSGKVHFGYIYGFGMSGCLAMSLILNLMSPNEAISVWTVISILGYALLPVNVLAGVNILLRVQRLGLLGMVLAGTTILWCTVSSTRLFEKGCGLRDQRYLVAYPVALLYSAFVMITIF